MYKKMNNRGFSLVELLAVITIMGILSGVGVTAYSKYREKANRQAYQIMSDNAATAAEEYFMDYKYENSVTFKLLVDRGYYETPLNPVIKGATCYGTVVRIDSATPVPSGNIEIPHFQVMVNCKKNLEGTDVSSNGFTSCYNYPEKTKCIAP